MAGPRNLLLLQLLLTLPVALHTAETTTSETTTSKTTTSETILAVTDQFNSSTPNINDTSQISTTSPVSEAFNTTGAVPDSSKPSTTFIQNSTSTYSTLKPENSTSNATESSKYTTRFIETNTSHVFSTYTTLRPENSTSNSTESQIWKDFTENPGLVAVICIFVSILVISLVVVIVKALQNNGPKFKKLDEVPMNGINEESPFAHYPPK